MSKKSKEILLYGNFGINFWTGEGITAKSFKQDFSALEADADVDEIHVRINSPGGSVFEGVAIYNIIQSSKKDVTTFVDGIAYSMAAVAALAGKKVVAAKNATILLHNASGVAFGNVRDMEQTVELLKKIDNSLAISIADKTGETVAEVQSKWMDYKDHTLSAQEALDAKLIDEILQTKADGVPANIKSMSQEEIFAHYAKMNNPAEKKGFFDDLVNAVKNILPKPIEQKIIEPINKKEMDFKNSLELLKKTTLTAEDTTAIIAEINSYTGAAEKFTKAEVDARIADAVKVANDAHTTSLKAATDKVTALEEQLDLDPATGRVVAIKEKDEASAQGAAAKDDYTTEVDVEARALRAKK